MARELLSAKYMHALNLVARLFSDRKRDMSDIPYTAHVFGVCHIVQQLTADEDVHIAALLHDVLEDIPSEIYSAKQLQADFGLRVLGLVQTVSLDEPRLGKDEARLQYLRQLEEGPIEACLISGADLLHNNRDLLYWLDRDPETTMRRFGGERLTRRQWFRQKRYEIIRRKLGADHPLVLSIEALMRDIAAADQPI